MRFAWALVVVSWAGGAEAAECQDWLTATFFRDSSDGAVLACAEAEGLQARAEDGGTALHLAAATDDAALVRALLIIGADPSLRDRSGLTPLDVAAERATDAAVAAALLAWGAPVDPPNRLGRPDRATTPLMRAARRPEAIGILTVLLAAGADPAWIDSDGNTALHLALGNPGGDEGARLLLQRGALADAQNDKGDTPLHVAAFYGASPDVVALLIEGGGSPDNEGNEGVTPLMLAASNASDPALLAALLDASEEPCEPDEATRTARLLAEANPALRDSPAYWRLNQLCPPAP